MNKNPLLKCGLCRKAILLVLVVGILMSIFMIPASAKPISQETYDTYTYWSAPGNKRGVSAAPMYEYKTTINGASLGISSFKEPSDIFVDSTSKIYLTDKKNSRIIVINPDHTLNRVLSEFAYNGEVLTLSSPSGVFVTANGDIYIADTENKTSIMQAIVEKCGIKTDAKGIVLSLPVDSVMGLGER